MSNLLYPQEAACLVRMVEACNLSTECISIKLFFIGERFLRFYWDANGAIVVRLDAGRDVGSETFPTLEALKAAYAID